MSSVKRKSIVDRAAQVGAVHKWDLCVWTAASIQHAQRLQRLPHDVCVMCDECFMALTTSFSVVQLNINVTNGKAKLRSQEDE